MITIIIVINNINEQKNMMYDKDEKVNKIMDEDRNNISI